MQINCAVFYQIAFGNHISVEFREYPTMEKAGVLIITRLFTQNAGNEALSKELLHYVSRSVPDAEVRTLDRYPRYFEQFTLNRLGNDPVENFEKQVDLLIRKFGSGLAPRPPIASEACVRLDHRGHELTGFLRRAKRRIAFRRRLAALGVIDRKARTTAVQACMNAELVVWNPAGEIRPTSTSVDHVVRLLLLLRIAQKSGRKTAVINHSLEVGDERLRALISHVYSSSDYVGLRDGKSIDTALNMGIAREKLVETPDLVFLASERPSSDTRHVEQMGAIGLSINGLEALAGFDEWPKLVEELAKLGRPLLFVSNAVNHDLDWARNLARLVPSADVVAYQPGYLELRQMYRRCSVLISSRLHASILALAEGVPVVSIEPSVFKLTAIFDQMGYPLRTERLQSEGWSDRVLSNVRLCLSPAGDALRSQSIAIVADQVKRIHTGYAPLFNLIHNNSENPKSVSQT
jgi:polysaccharide pyruvyl transferase WcaK-like protein